MANGHKRKNTIRGLTNDLGILETEDDKIQRIVVDYFQKLFTASKEGNAEGILPMLRRRLRRR